MTTQRPSEPYQGPVPIVTIPEAELMLPHLRDVPGLEETVTRLEAAVHSHATWRTPLR